MDFVMSQLLLINEKKASYNSILMIVDCLTNISLLQVSHNHDQCIKANNSHY